ncbi:MAG: Omp28-related outer membrane protein [Bacteroidetes bacterium]|nr:Omp28-related outer membrane protein [Bacteroidota bacterium]MBU1719039.1 Omp28-related outer membrane protein [Bacteroidota bacterium]
MRKLTLFLLLIAFVGIQVNAQRDPNFLRSPNNSFSPESVVQAEKTDRAFVLNEGFESLTFPPTGWTKQSPDLGSGWERAVVGTTPISGWTGGTISSPVPGTGVAFCTYTTGGASANDQWLISPQFTPQTGDSLSFWIIRDFAAYMDQCDVLLSTTTNSTSSFTVTLEAIVFAASGSDVWIRKAYSMNAYAGQPIYIAFREHVADNVNDGAAISIDNVRVGTPPPLDANLSALTMSPYVTAGNQNVTGTIINDGSDAISAIDLNYTINSGSVVTANLTGLSIASGAAYNFTHTTPASMASVGTYNVKVWISAVNGSQDALQTNDTLSTTVSVLSSIPAKYVLIEEATGAWCGYCPDGAVKLLAILAAQSNAIGSAVHDGDGMSFTDGDAINSAFIGGYPSGLVDRYKFSGESAVELDRGSWAAKVTERLNMVVPVGVTATHTYNSTTRQLVVDLTATFTGNVTGDYRVNCFITEDSVSGTGADYDQANYYNATAGHPMQGLGNPIIGFQHRHVLRYCVGGPWGTASVIPASVTDGQTFTKQYTYTLPAGWKADDCSFIVAVQKYGTTTSDRAVMNAREYEIDVPVGIASINSMENSFKFIPETGSGIAILSMSVANTNPVSVRILDITGRVVYTETFGNLAAGNHVKALPISNLNNNVYFVQVSFGQEVKSKKTAIVR